MQYLGAGAQTCKASARPACHSVQEPQADLSRSKGVPTGKAMGQSYNSAGVVLFAQILWVRGSSRPC